MSNTLAIGAVTATLRNLLEKAVAEEGGGMHATTLAPEKAQIFGQADGPGRVNLFLYQTQINAAWRNMDMPRQTKPNETGQPPLALDLYYLLTAYEREDGDVSVIAHRLLGRAMRVLHDHPLLGAGEIRSALPNNDLADQIERIRIVPQTMSVEEFSKLWTTFQVGYRISAAYHVSVVLIDSTLPSHTPLPVLARGAKDRGPSAVAGNSLPVITSVLSPNNQSSAFLGDQLTIVGQNLGDLSAVRFTLINSQIPSVAPILLPPAATQVMQDGITVNLPNDAAAQTVWAAGFYTVAVVVNRAVNGSAQTWSSNELPLSVAPRIQQITPANPHPDVNGKVSLTVTCQPEIKLALVDATHTRFAQQVILLLGTARQIAPEPPPAPPATTTGTVEFIFPVAPAELGEYLARLRVDGVDLPIVDRTVTPPVFAASQKVRIS